MCPEYVATKLGKSCDSLKRNNKYWMQREVVVAKDYAAWFAQYSTDHVAE